MMVWTILIGVGLIVVVCNVAWFCVSLLRKAAPSPVPLLGSLTAAIGLVGLNGFASPWWIVVLVVDPGGVVWLIFSLLWYRGSGRPGPPGSST